jgi:signal transduction histidine kinase
MARNGGDDGRAPAREWLVGGGEMAKVISGKDWSTTPLGPIDAWPQSLRTTVSLAQASNSPISLAWGVGHVQIYNDGYWPICGAKHPHSMGQDFRECWASAFPVIGEAYETAWAGRSAYLENMRMFLDRYGFLEETWFTFSFSPITDESGKVGGLFHPVTEVTSAMLSERRTATLRDLAARTSKAQTAEEALELAVDALRAADLDVPFVLFYLVEPELGHARLVAHAGVAPGSALAPATIDLEARDDVWSIANVATTGAAEVIEHAATFADIAVGPYPEAPRAVLAVPVAQPGSATPAAVMIAGVSARLLLTEPYRAFYDIVAGSVSAAVANARAYEAERRRSEALAEVDRAKTAFFSNVSHEFRTPLTLILGPLEDELAERDGALPPERHQRLGTVHRNALRLLKLVNTLLDFSRIEAGRMQASFESVDLAVETAELASVFRSAFAKAGLAFEVDCRPLPEPIWIDREMWEKVALNLLSNALKHTFEGGVTVQLRWTGEGAELLVQDTGVGISADELPRVFERFHRVKGTRARSHEGTGIGLALVRELVQLHGGSVRAESREGQGTTFVVALRSGTAHLPPDRIGRSMAHPGRQARAAAFVEEAMHWLPGTSDGQVDATPRIGGEARPRILWADDNADMRDYVARLLASEYEVVAVGDGAAALESALGDPPDLVLSDVMMPELDGFGLLQVLRSDPRTRTVPVILLSARAGEEAALEGLHAGADDYLVKPFSARELLARVRTHLQLGHLRRAWACELERANEELAAFSYSVSHDLRAPLRSIDGFSQALLEDCGDTLDDTGKRYLARVRGAAQRMGELIDDLLELSRVTRAELRIAHVDVTALVRSIVGDLAGRHGERPVEVAVQDGMAVAADGRLLRVALENLLGNAWKFTASSSSPRVEVVAQRRGEALEITVRDNGAGFDPSYASKLFRPFQRLHAATEFPGTGIGLATVARIVTRHGGSVRAEGEIDRGAAFSVMLPFAHRGPS